MEEQNHPDQSNSSRVEPNTQNLLSSWQKSTRTNQNKYFIVPLTH